MDQDEVFDAIENAITAIREYREQRMQQDTTSKQDSRDIAIKNASIKFLHQAFEPGPPGNACDKCNGTGREP